MSRQAPIPTMVELPTGVQVSAMCRATTDWPSVRCMMESGVPREEVAVLFKISPHLIKEMSFKEKWMTPTRVDKLRKELARVQRETYENAGITKTAVEAKAVVWEERSERWKERMAEIVDGALEGVTKTKIKRMIHEPKDLKVVMEVARTLTGETQAESNAPALAVNIGFLRSGNAPRIIEAQVVPGSDSLE